MLWLVIDIAREITHSISLLFFDLQLPLSPTSQCLSMEEYSIRAVGSHAMRLTASNSCSGIPSRRRMSTSLRKFTTVSNSAQYRLI
jgi:hypothetical protein